MARNTLEPSRYSVTYAFETDRHGTSEDVTACIRDCVAALRRDGWDIAFCGAVQLVDAGGQIRLVTAYYDADTEGTIGVLNCHALLPACGRPQRFASDGASAADGHVLEQAVAAAAR
jgi:hypothetical protein